MAIKDRLKAARDNLKKIGDTMSAFGARIKDAVTGSPTSAGGGADAPKTTAPEISPDAAQEIRKSTQQRDRLQEKRDTEVGLRKRLKEIDSTHNTSELDADIKNKDTQIQHLNDYIDRTKASAEAAGKKKGFFARAWDWFKKNILGMGTTPAGGGQDATASTKSTSTANEGKRDPVVDAIKSKTPEQQTAKKQDQGAEVSLKDGRHVLITCKQPDNNPDLNKPGHIFSSSNVDHFTFREPSKVEGVPGKEVQLPDGLKQKIVEALSEIETRSLKKTADRMGLDYSNQRSDDGSIHHKITNKDGTAITAEKFNEFKTENVKDFNEIAQEVCKEKGFTITKHLAQQPQEQRTLSSDRAAAQSAQANKAPEAPPPPSNTQGLTK